MRSRTTRTPSRCAFLASRSQASQTRCVKQRLPPSNSVSVSSCHRPYQPMAEPLISTAGSLLQPRDQAHHRARHAQPRRQDLAALAARPQPIADRLAGEIDHGVDARVARRSGRGSVTSRNGGRSVAALAGSRASTVTSCPALGERLDQPAADEAGRAGDQHMLPARQRIDERCRVRSDVACAARKQMRGHDANSRYKRHLAQQQAEARMHELQGEAEAAVRHFRVDHRQCRRGTASPAGRSAGRTAAGNSLRLRKISAPSRTQTVERHADAVADIFLEPGRPGEALGGMHDLRKAVAARIDAGPDLAAARLVLGHRHDARNVRAARGRQRPADQPQRLRQQPAADGSSGFPALRRHRPWCRRPAAAC